MEGKMMSMIVSRAPGWEPPKKQAPAPAPAKKHQAHKTEEETAPPVQVSTETIPSIPEPVLVPEERESEKPPVEEA
jgi:translation initiation factor IF-3